MEIAVVFLLVGVWAAFVLPSFAIRRRSAVNRQHAPAGAMGALPADLRRRQVLARRRLALIALMVAAVATLVGAVLTGSYLFLGLTLAIDVMLAIYIAVLLQIKHQQVGTRPPAPGPDRVGVSSY